MLSRYTAKYTRLRSSYMGQLIEWPEVVTEGKTLEECRVMLQDALRRMVVAYREQSKEIPQGGALFEQLSVEIEGELDPVSEVRKWRKQMVESWKGKSWEEIQKKLNEAGDELKRKIERERRRKKKEVSKNS